MEKIIKNCRGVKQCSDGTNRIEKEGQRENFRVDLVFKEHNADRRIFDNINNLANVSK